MRQELVNLNNSLFLSEAHENIDFLIPFDEVSIGSKQKVFLLNYQKDSIWHRSGLESLVPSTIASVLQQKNKMHDMGEIVKHCIYNAHGSTLNIVTPQL